MKWLPENLFEHQFIRPKRAFRDCYNKNCKSDKRRLHIVNTTRNGKTYKEVLQWCNCCYDEEDDYSITIPAYLIDYSLLLAMHSDLNNPKCLVKCSEKMLESTIDYYKTLKKTIAKDPYFKHLKRVRNRRLLQNKK